MGFPGLSNFIAGASEKKQICPRTENTYSEGRVIAVSLKVPSLKQELQKQNNSNYLLSTMCIHILSSTMCIHG